MVEMPVAVASSVLRPSIKRRVHDRDAFALEKVQELLGRIGRGEVRELGRERRERIDHQATRAGARAPSPAASPNWSSTLGPRVRVEYILSRPDFRCGARSNAHRSEIADDLRRAFVEAHVQGALAALAGGGGEESGQRRLGGAGRAGDEDVAAAVIAAAQHVVEARKPRRDPFVGDFVLELGGTAIGQLHAFRRERDRETRRPKSPSRGTS